MPTHGIGRYRHLLPKVLVRPSFAHHHHQYNRIHSQPVPVNKCDLKNYSSNSKRKSIVKKPRVSISTKANTDLYNGNLKPNSFN